MKLFVPWGLFEFEPSIFDKETVAWLAVHFGKVGPEMIVCLNIIANISLPKILLRLFVTFF